MLTTCKIGEISSIFTFSSVSYIGVKIEWKGRFNYNLNVYSPYLFHLKRKLWKDILDITSKYIYEDWIIGSDFNAISKFLKRKSSSSFNRSREIREFRDFLGCINLVDMSCMRNKFTF